MNLTVMNRLGKSGLCLLGVFFFTLTAVRAESEFTGYFKSLLLLQQYSVDHRFGENVDFGGQIQFNGRVMADVYTVDRQSDQWRVQMHYELEYLNTVEELALLERGGDSRVITYRLTDIDNYLENDRRKQRIRRNLDRLFLQYSGDKDDLVFGRQAISFGASRVVSPFDVFVPYHLQDLNTEYRIGVDGVRWTHALGELSELDLGVVFSDTREEGEHTHFVRGKSSWRHCDWEAVFIHRSGYQVVGFGLQTSLDDVGVWVEMTTEESKTLTNEYSRYERASVGVDYGFGSDIYGALEMHFNGAGANDAEGYAGLVLLPAYRNGSVYLLGKAYAAGLMRWTWSALISTGYQLMVNLNDHSLLASATLNYSLGDESDLGIGVFIPVGDNPERVDLNAIQLKSEFGSYSQLFYLNLNYYF